MSTATWTKRGMNRRQLCKVTIRFGERTYALNGRGVVVHVEDINDATVFASFNEAKLALRRVDVNNMRAVRRLVYPVPPDLEIKILDRHNKPLWRRLYSENHMKLLAYASGV